MSSTADKDKSNVIAEFNKDSSGQAKYVVALNDFQGNHYVDLRLFFIPEGQDEFVATRKGLSISVDFLGNLMDALQKVKDTVERGSK